MPLPNLIAHWPLAGDSSDATGRHHGTPTNVDWTEGPGGTPNGAALFNGRDSLIEVTDAPEFQLGCADFSISAWIKCADPMRGAYGDILSKFDGERRCGLNFWVGSGSSCYGSFSDARHIHVGIDDGYMSEWKDCGHPGEGTGNPLVGCITVFEGDLYAGVTDAAKPEDAARVYRLAGGNQWIDCGRLGNDPEHLSVMSMIVHDGHLYAGTGIWDWGRAEEARVSDPPRALTRVFRYEGGHTWTDLGQVGAGQRVFCMASFNGHLYAGIDRGGGGGCFKLVGDTWESAGNLDEKDNFECLMPVNGTLYGASHFAVYKFDGEQTWTCIGRRPFDIEQIHAFQVFDSKLWVGTWPQGFIMRYEGGENWTNTGLVGIAVGKPGVARINEINALGVHNGKLYSGTIPKAQVYRYEFDGHWSLQGSLASSPNWDPAICPTWMRILTLTTHKGMLFTSTGTSQARHWDLDAEQTAGRVLYCQTGMAASHEHDIGGDWTHVAVVRTDRELQLFVNGTLSHRMPAPYGQHFHLGNAEPLRIGTGAQSSFDGAISDVRLYGGALDAGQVRELAGNS